MSGIHDSTILLTGGNGTQIADARVYGIFAYNDGTNKDIFFWTFSTPYNVTNSDRLYYIMIIPVFKYSSVGYSISYSTIPNIIYSNTADNFFSQIASKYSLDASKFEVITPAQVSEWVLTNIYSFNSDPVYVEATKLRYTDGTYNFIRGAATAERARKAAYGSLLRTYGTFYRGTERELSESFLTSLPQVNGGGVTKSDDICSLLYNRREAA